MPELEPNFIAATVAQAFEDLGIPYFIGGSIASSLYGMVRTTQDADFVADLQQKHVSSLVKLLQIDFYIDEAMVTTAVTRRSSFNIIHRDSMFKIDIFVAKDDAFTKLQFSRAQEETLSTDPEMKANIASAEDTLLAKLDWYRQGGELSERQWRDVIGMLKIQQDALDLAYLRDTAKLLKLENLLEQVLREGGSP